jgi:chitosanase
VKEHHGKLKPPAHFFEKMITPEQYRIIDRWISAVETGKPDGDYGKVTVLPDGPRGVRQITFGVHQTTEAGGNLKELVGLIMQNRINVWGHITRSQAGAITKFLTSEPYEMAESELLISALKIVGLISKEIQDEFFNRKYWFPACRWAEKNGFKSPLAYLVIYDSFIQSGGILMFLRKRFPETAPANGGDEHRWLYQYVQTRHQWLKHWGNGKDPKSVTLRKTIYRTDSLIRLVSIYDLDLESTPMIVNGIRVD